MLCCRPRSRNIDLARSTGFPRERSSTANTSTLVRVHERPVRSRLRRAVLAAILPALVAAAPALADDTRAGDSIKPVPEQVETSSDKGILDQTPSGEPVTTMPEEAETDSENGALDQASAGEPVTTSPQQVETDPDKGILDPTPSDEPVTTIPEGTETDSEDGALGQTSAGESVAPSPQQVETDPDRGILDQTPSGEPVAPIPEGTETDSEDGTLDQTSAGESVTPSPQQVETDPDKGILDQTPSGEPVAPSPQQSETRRGRGMLDRATDREPIKPIPEEDGVDPEKVALGRALFHDPRLSKDNTTACVSCHDLGSGGDDGRKVSIGVEGKPGTINAPTVFNVGLNFKQFWDGRADTLEQQIDGPVQSPVEMGSLWPELVAKLYAHESYPGRFKALYPDGINRKNVKNALAEFMKSLTTPNSRFDQWLKGDDAALSTQEKYGYALFKHYGCISCHQGANVGGNMFQVFGVLNEYFKKRGDITDADFGRFNLTGNPTDRHAFKVPSLRVAALTAPYLHDGSAATLRDAVDAMFEYQLGREAPDEDKEAIVAFIKALAGENRELSP